MSALTRRSDNHNGWHVYFGDVRIGQIGRRSGVPDHADQWGWIIGFHPGPRTRLTGSAPSFEVAREQFEVAWARFAPSVTEEHLENWRRSRDFHAWKHRMWDKGCRLPTQNQDGLARCFCGEPITDDSIELHIQAAHRGIGA